jgi:hypothetical protein
VPRVPSPFLDWFYGGRRLKVGGLVLVDDTNLWTGRVLAEFLRREPEWEHVLSLPKAAVFRKLAHAAWIKEWTQQPFLKERAWIAAPGVSRSGDSPPESGERDRAPSEPRQESPESGSNPSP